MNTNETPVIIVGPTAAGKTEIAIELAERLNGEIISADSMQVYCEMDIGTAKPSTDQQKRAIFHLIDIVSPQECFTASNWRELAEAAILDIQSRNRLPILCGGTGLYVKALLEGWTMAETPADPSIRETLKAEANELGSLALHTRLREIDPETAQRLHPNDAFRIIRALEVYKITGTPISVFQAQDRNSRLVRPAHRIGITLPRPLLYERIDRRVDDMIASGLEEEGRSLLARGYSPLLSPLRSLGYKEIIAYIEREMDLMDCINAIKQNTRRYAKRQQTWFRADTQIAWFDTSALNSAPDSIMEWLESQ